MMDVRSAITADASAEELGRAVDELRAINQLQDRQPSSSDRFSIPFSIPEEDDDEVEDTPSSPEDRPVQTGQQDPAERLILGTTTRHPRTSQLEQIASQGLSQMGGGQPVEPAHPQATHEAATPSAAHPGSDVATGPDEQPSDAGGAGQIVRWRGDSQVHGDIAELPPLQETEDPAVIPPVEGTQEQHAGPIVLRRPAQSDVEGEVPDLGRATRSWGERATTLLGKTTVAKQLRRGDDDDFLQQLRAAPSGAGSLSLLNAFSRTAGDLQAIGRPTEQTSEAQRNYLRQAQGKITPAVNSLLASTRGLQDGSSAPARALKVALAAALPSAFNLLEVYTGKTGIFAATTTSNSVSAGFAAIALGMNAPSSSGKLLDQQIIDYFANWHLAGTIANAAYAYSTFDKSSGAAKMLGSNVPFGFGMAAVQAAATVLVQNRYAAADWLRGLSGTAHKRDTDRPAEFQEGLTQNRAELMRLSGQMESFRTDFAERGGKISETLEESLSNFDQHLGRVTDSLQALIDPPNNPERAVSDRVAGWSVAAMHGMAEAARHPVNTAAATIDLAAKLKEWGQRKATDDVDLGNKCITLLAGYAVLGASTFGVKDDQQALPDYLADDAISGSRLAVTVANSRKDRSAMATTSRYTWTQSAVSLIPVLLDQKYNYTNTVAGKVAAAVLLVAVNTLAGDNAADAVQASFGLGADLVTSPKQTSKRIAASAKDSYDIVSSATQAQYSRLSGAIGSVLRTARPAVEDDQRPPGVQGGIDLPDYGQPQHGQATSPTDVSSSGGGQGTTQQQPTTVEEA